MGVTFRFLAGAAALCALAGCGGDEAAAVIAVPPPPPPGVSAETAAADQACLRDVAAASGNAEVSVVSSTFAEAGTEVLVLVGGTGTWSCTAYSDGTTAGIQSLSG
jgi:hypothetical protein